MKADRYAFDVLGQNDEGMMILNCGDGVNRCRNMSIEFMKTVATQIEKFRVSLSQTSNEHPELLGDVPQYPDCKRIGEGTIGGVCDIVVVASGNDDEVEVCLALYDAGDHEWPVMVLVDEQIEEFVEKIRSIIGMEERTS